MSVNALGSRLAARAATAQSSPIDDLFALLRNRPDVISFAAGAPDPSLLPVELLATLTQRALRRFGPQALQYGLVQGFPPLREAAVPLLARHRVRAEADDIHVSTGASGALHNLCMVLLDEGDTVLVERPTYEPAMQTMRAHGANLVAVETDAHGIVPTALDAALRRHLAQLVYLGTTFANPTGHCMPHARRRQVADVLIAHDVLAIEDDVYYDLRYHGHPVAALQSFAPDHVAYLTSLSKIFAPAVRVGLAVVPAGLRDAMHRLKQGIDMQTSTLAQAIATEFLIRDDHTGQDYRTHLAEITDAYAAKLDLMLDALTTYMPDDFRWTRPDGGMFVWLQGPAGFDADALLPAAIDAGVAYLPGSGFFPEPDPPRNALRLSFAHPPAEQIEAGIQRLAWAVDAP